MRVVRRRMLERAVQPPRRRLVERIDDERRFAAARDAGDAGEHAERNVGVTFFRLLPRAPTTRACARLQRLAAHRRNARPTCGR